MSRASDLEAELRLLKDAAAEAARITMRYFRRDPQVTMKIGNSPVTEADLAADKYLRETLMAARPDYGWLSEETKDSPQRLSRRRCFIVDPIDGTKAFIAGDSRWCISVALVEDGEPVAGVLDCPVRDEIFEASLGGGSRLNGRNLADAAPPASGVPQFAGARTWLQAYAARHGIMPGHVSHIPSLAYRVACVADQRFAGTFIKPDCHDWDIAAAALILSETGGALRTADGGHVSFNRENPSHGLLIAATKAYIEPMLAVAGPEAAR